MKRFSSQVALACTLAVLALLLASLPARAEDRVPPPTDRLPSLIVGVSAIEPSVDTQVDGLRNIHVWGYLYNASNESVVLDWRTRRLRTADGRMTAENSRHDFEGAVEVRPGQFYLFHPTFYIHRGRRTDYVFSVRDARSDREYRVPTVPRLTNVGPFESLSAPVQRTLINAFMSDTSHHWWWAQY